MERITVVKIGGNVIDSPAAMARFVEEFAALEGPKMLIHGGGKLATRLAAQLGIEAAWSTDGASPTADARRGDDGLRRTDKQAARRRLAAAGCRDPGCRAPTAMPSRCGVRPPAVDYGYVGDIEGG